MKPLTIIGRVGVTEALRCIRRRETFWTLAGTATAFGFFGLMAGRMASIDLPADPPFLFIAVCEALSVAVLGLLLGQRSLREELETGSWILLAQTPNPPGRLVLGKVAGLAVTLLVSHAFLFLWVVVARPFVRVSHADFLLLFAGVFLWGAAAIPEGMVYAVVARKAPLLSVPVRATSMLRIGLAVPFILFAARPDFLGQSPTLIPFRLFPMEFTHPYVPWLILVAAQLVTAVPYLAVLFRVRL